MGRANKLIAASRPTASASAGPDAGGVEQLFDKGIFWNDGLSAGNLSNAADHQEISDLAPAVKVANSGILWAIVDGATNYLLALNTADATTNGKWTCTGLTTSDVESMASANIGGLNYVYLGDTGDNANARGTFKIVRIIEPTVTGSDGATTDFEEIVGQFTGTAPTHKDVECMLVDPATGDMFVITKREALPGVYKLDHAASYAGTQDFVFQGDMFAIPDSYNTNSPSNGGNVTGGAISPDGTEILIKNYSNVYHFTRDPNTQTILEALQGAPTVLPSYVGGPTANLAAAKVDHPTQEPQGEAICWSSDGRDYWTASEYASAHGSSATSFPLYQYVRSAGALITAEFQQGVFPTAGYTGCEDTYIENQNINTAHGSDITFIVDIDTIPTDVRIGLIRFDLTSIPTNAVVVGCYLDLYINTEGEGWTFHKILKDWEPTESWADMGGMPIDDVSAASLVECLTGTNKFGDVNVHHRNNLLQVTSDTVQGWINTPSTNRGWCLHGVHPTNGQQFRSAEATTPADRPRLVVRYYIP